MKKLNSKGFGIVESLLLVVIVGIIGGVSYYVYSSQKTTDSSLGNTSNSQSEMQKVENDSKSNQKVATKQYKNSEYGFSFDYPETWKITDSLVQGRGAKEGEVIVESSNGTKVYFNLNQGGKGGDCWDDQANAHTTRTCQTRTIISLEKLPTSSKSNPVYFYKASMTDSTSAGGKTVFYVYAGSGEFTPTETGSLVGAFITYWSELTTNKNQSVGVKVEGKDDAKNTSSAFFETQEVQEATPVLKSIKFL